VSQRAYNVYMTPTDTDLATLSDARYAAATVADAYTIGTAAWEARETAYNAWAAASKKDNTAAVTMSDEEYTERFNNLMAASGYTTTMAAKKIAFDTALPILVSYDTADRLGLS
jgi:hypothetical protein